MTAIVASYNTLASLGYADETFTNRQNIFEKVGSLLAAYPAFGLCLVHAHCKLHDGEIMLAGVKSLRQSLCRTIKPITQSAGCALDSHTNSRRSQLLAHPSICSASFDPSSDPWDQSRVYITTETTNQV